MFGCLLAITVGVALNENAARNVEALNPSETLQWLRLEELHWQGELSPGEVDQAIVGLGSPKDTVVEAAIGAVALHRVRAAIPLLRKGVGTSNGYNRLLGSEVAKALESGMDPITYLRGGASNGAAPPELPRDVRAMMVNLVVIAEVKEARSGKETPDVRGLELTDLQKTLLDYSRSPRRDAIAEIIGKLSQAKIARKIEYHLVEVLQTYGHETVIPVLERLEKPFDPAQASVYAKVLLLNALRPFAFELTSGEAARLRMLLNRLGKMDEKPLINAVASFEAALKYYERAKQGIE